MNIKHTASVEAVRLSIEWVDNMAKSKHNIKGNGTGKGTGTILCRINHTATGPGPVPLGFCLNKPLGWGFGG